MRCVKSRDARGGAFGPRGGAGRGKGESLWGGAREKVTGQGVAWQKNAYKSTDL